MDTTYISGKIGGGSKLHGSLASIPGMHGIIPTGILYLTNLNETDATQYAYAQIRDAFLQSDNIKQGVTILGVPGSFEGGALDYSTHVKSIKNPQTATPGSGFYGFGSIEIDPIVNKSINDIGPLYSGTSDQTILPGTGYDGLDGVVVKGSANLIPKNIKNGVVIWNDNHKQLIGTYVPDTINAYTYSDIRSNGSYTVTKPAAWDGMSSVSFKVDVPSEINDKGTLTISSANNVNFASSEIVWTTNGTAYTGWSRIVFRGDPDLKAENIKSGKTLFGVEGTCGGVSQDKTVASLTFLPNSNSVTIRPDQGYDVLSSVTIVKDPNLLPAYISEDVSIFGIQGTLKSDMHLENKSYTPRFTEASEFSTVPLDDGYDAFSNVRIAKDIDLTAENIARGVEIYGITGTYRGKRQHGEGEPSLIDVTYTPGNDMDGYYDFTVKAAVVNVWRGTQAEYDALASTDNSTLYAVLKEVS